jgi:hypothetical protein
MSGFVPVRLDQFIKQYLRNNQGVDGEWVRAAVEDALAAWRQGVRCACGNPIWVAGSAVAGYGCFACITGSPEPNGDPEIDSVCKEVAFEADDPDAWVAKVNQIMKNHPRDYRQRLEEVGFVWQDDDHERRFEEETIEERAAIAETEKQRQLVRFLESGGPVTPPIVEAYLAERFTETANLPLIRKYFKQANVNLKAILLSGLAANPTDLDLLDDLSYFSEFDNMLGELIHSYTAACIMETDMDRFSMLAQEFYMNTLASGFDALHELTTIFQSGTKRAMVQHLSETIDAYLRPDDIPI